MTIYIGHNYIGRNYIVMAYIVTAYIGHNYIGASVSTCVLSTRAALARWPKSSLAEAAKPISGGSAHLYINHDHICQADLGRVGAPVYKP